MTSEMIDLRHNYPVLESQSQIIGNLFLTTPSLSEKSLQLAATEGTHEDREIAAEWLSNDRYIIKPEQILIGIGAHNSLLVAILAADLIGKTIAVEELTYASFKSIAAFLDISLVPVKMDEEGLLPDSLEEKCKANKIAALYFMPTVHNPTGSVMPIDRRHAISNLANKYGFLIIEDDAYGFLDKKKLPNFGMLAPERSFYIQSFSKPFAPGLKVAYIIAPLNLTSNVIQVLSATNSNSAPFMTEVCSALIANGTMQRVIDEKRTEGASRQSKARKILDQLSISAHPNSWHLWAKLPPKVNADAFTARANQNGVDINSSSNFAAPGTTPIQAIRIGLGGTQNEDKMVEGLNILKDVLNHF